MDQASPALPVINLTKLTDPELESLLPAVEQELATRKATREAAFFARIQEDARILGLTPARVKAALAGQHMTDDGRKTVKAVYWHPADHSQRWSGRGTPPKWFTDFLARPGATKEAMLIPEGAL